MAQSIKEFKYQRLMDEKKVKEPCPFNNCSENNLDEAFHFGFDPLSNNKNFVPGHMRHKQRINDENDPINCAYCGLSMFKTKKGATHAWWETLNNRQRSLLKYTHLLKGQLKKELGVMSNNKGEHFTFFEYKEVELRQYFEVLDTL